MIASPILANGISLARNAAALALAAVTAPAALELSVLTLASLLPRRTTPTAAHLIRERLTVVVPAHNEAALIGRTVQSLLADLPRMDLPDTGLPKTGSVLVVAHNSTDRTAAAAEEAGAQVLVLNDATGEGKGAALRAGFAQAIAQGATLIAVVDADSVVAPGFSSAILNAAASGVEAFQARYVVMGAHDEEATRLTALGFLGFNVIRPRGRARLGLSAGIFGNGFGMRASVLERVPYAASSLVEDLEYHLRLVEAGVRVAFLEDATVSSEMPAAGAGRASQRARWEGGRLRMARVWLPRLLRQVFTGRMRLLEPALDLACQPLAQQAALLGLALLVPVGWLRIYALSAISMMLLHVLIAAADGMGLRQALRTLVAAPGYILWKLALAPRTVASARRNAAWVRTAREPLADHPAHELATAEFCAAGNPAEGNR